MVGRSERRPRALGRRGDLERHERARDRSHPDVRDALRLSFEIELIATTFALVLGSMASFAIHRFSFFGREAS